MIVTRSQEPYQEAAVGIDQTWHWLLNGNLLSPWALWLCGDERP